MSKWNVLVTGCSYVEVEADTCEEAEDKALYKVDPMTMRFDAVCEEADRIKEEL
jgi:hypothetical protein